MLLVLLSIAPVFALIVLGHVLRRIGIPSVEFWNINDKLVYWVLFPALLFTKTSTLSLTGALLGDYALVILGGFAAATLFSLAAGRLFALDGPVASSVLQGAARHNTFIALAVAESLFGADGLALAALCTALLIPVTNIVVVGGIVALVHPTNGKGFGPLFARELLRNPLIIAVLLGVAVNLGGIGEVPVVHDVTGLLGQAALPIMLLCVGANIRLQGIRGSLIPFAISGLGKLVVFPAVAAALLAATGLTGPTAIVPMIYGAAATASSGYTLARAMGGDAPLMAGIITFQTLVSMVTMPLTIVLAQSMFS
jgi:predicted permease